MKLKICKTEIPQSTKVRFLGANLDEKLLMKCHIAMVMHLVAKGFYQIVQSSHSSKN
jgi:hypothetical protein